MKIMSVTQYAKLMGISRQAVLQRLTPEIKPMKFVVKAKKVGSTWVLHVKQ